MAGLGGRTRPFVAACLYYSGLVGLARWRTQQQGSHVVILNYHRASHSNLRRQFLYLRRHYRVLPLETALEELFQSGQAGEREQAQPQASRCTALAITFDDGYRDNYTHAYVLARELQIPISVFLIPSYIESGEPFWWREGKRLAQQARVDEVLMGDKTYRLAQQPGARAALAAAIDARARQASSVADREAFLCDIRTALAIGEDPKSVDEELARPLTWAEVHEMAASGWVSFGAHTQHHPVLAYLTDSKELTREVSECRQVLEQQLGQPMRTFAYPIGKPEHIGTQAPKAVQQAGYRWALTTVRGVNTPQTNPYLLRRVGTDHDEHWLVVAAQAAGVWTRISRPKTKARLAPG